MIHFARVTLADLEITSNYPRSEDPWMNAYNGIRTFIENGLPFAPCQTNWMRKQRASGLSEELILERIALLNDINFIFASQKTLFPIQAGRHGYYKDDTWMQQFNEIRNAKENEIPFTPSQNDWMSRQRSYAKKDKMSDERRELLDSIEEEMSEGADVEMSEAAEMSEATEMSQFVASRNGVDINVRVTLNGVDVTTDINCSNPDTLDNREQMIARRSRRLSQQSIKRGGAA
ncbi:hypothetical protein ACHAWO_011058 [Cyclotella atomus]|uniref:Uncharacterized protein n=1 Tax=Cyclotella atomus TaxID=382360 RepID=A0ABD3QEL9_9STRA